MDRWVTCQRLRSSILYVYTIYYGRWTSNSFSQVTEFVAQVSIDISLQLEIIFVSEDHSEASRPRIFCALSMKLSIKRTISPRSEPQVLKT